MDVTPLVKKDACIIQSYGQGKFRISGNVYEGAVLVFPDDVIPWDFKGTVQDLQEHDFKDLAERQGQVDVVLLGSGSAISFLKPALKKNLRTKGLPFESMDTGAACRTYNVLMAEGRRVAAALLPT